MKILQHKTRALSLPPTVPETGSRGETSINVDRRAYKAFDEDDYLLAENILLEKSNLTRASFARRRHASLLALCRTYLPEKLKEVEKDTKNILSDLLCDWVSCPPIN